MKRFLQISIVYILFLHPLAGKAFTNSFQQLNLPNTTAEQDTIKENQLIQQVIHSKKNPTKGNIEFLNQVNKYGFKNLFSNSLFLLIFDEFESPVLSVIFLIPTIYYIFWIKFT